MSKIIVQTVDTTMLLDMGCRPAQEVPYNRPAVVVRTNLINQRIGTKQLEVLLEDLPDSACDKAFAKTFAESAGDDVDVEKQTTLAVKAFEAEVKKAEAAAKKKAEAEAKKAEADAKKAAE